MRTSILNHSKRAAVFAAALLIIASAATSSARDRFEYDPTPKAPEKPKTSGGSSATSSAPKSGIKAVIAAGESREVFNSASAPAMAFYVPETNPTIVQVVIQKGLFKKPVYFAKGIRPGTVTGGIVPRALLDKAGFRPNNITDAAAVQAAMKANPITITVK